MSNMTPKIKDTLKLLAKIGVFSKESLTKTFEQSLGYKYHVKKEAIDEIVDFYMYDETYLDHTIAVANIYGSYYTHKEIKGIIAFYDSPLGQKMLQKAPKIADEVFEASVKLAEKSQDFMTSKIVEILEKHDC
jgi:uncharacterized protein